VATNPAEVLGLPKPAWAGEYVGMLYDMATRFLSEEIAPRYDEFEKAEKFDRESWTKAGEAGLLCASMPEEFGGSGGTFAHESAIIEAIGHVGVDGFGISLHNSIVAPYILHYGSEEQKKNWLPRMATGELIGAIAMTEPGAGSDLQGVKTVARKDGNHYRISGSKTFITNGQLANLIIVVTKTDPSAGAKGTSLIMVETDEVEGFERGRNLDKIGLHSQDTAELFFDNVRLTRRNLLGEENQGFPLLTRELAWERLQIAVAAVATSSAALQWTIDYTRQRKAFGTPIAEFQNTRFRLAEIKTEIEIAQVFIDRCLAETCADKLDKSVAAMAKYWCTELVGRVVDQCLQLHGGSGYIWDTPIARAFADARVHRIYGGSNEIMRELIARTL
jgi:acyl-CoA dehydrogenase